MSGDSLLQIFVLVQVFLIGFLATIVFRHGYFHIRPRRDQQPKTAPPPTDQSDTLPVELKAKMVRSSQEHFQQALEQSFEQLRKDLEVTSQHINNLVMRVATEIVSGELEKYRTEFGELHKQAAADMGSIKDQLTKHRTELESKLEQEVQAEKQKLIKQMDDKLGDAVASFLLETLQHNVDLGNQNQYLISMLEEHKADLIKEVSDESEPAK